MRIFKKILAIAFCCALVCGVLYVGGYSFNDFATSIGLKNPVEVFDPFVPDANNSDDAANSETSSTSETNNSNNSDSSKTDSTATTENTSSKTDNSKVEWFPEDLEFSKNEKDEFSGSAKKVFVTIGQNAFTVTKDTVFDFVKWLQNNYKDGDSVSIGSPSSSSDSTDSTNNSSTSSNQSTNSSTNSASTSSTQTNNESSSTISSVTSSNNVSSTPTESEPIEKVPSYNTTLQGLDDLQALINDIEIVDTLPKYDDYDRNDFESPAKSYTYNGNRYNRNDYSWKTSPWLISEEPFQYKCPYTGQIITNDSKLDYDHIVPLKSAYLRGAINWSDEMKNAYSYDQYIGIDVLNSANRSKSDKGPEKYLPKENIEDYCYSWLLICSKYDLVMTDEEIAICDKYIKDAIAINEPVTHLGGVNP